MPSLLSQDLNEPQSEAVAHVEGPLLVFAGAGSGKTRVITYRIARLVSRHHIFAPRILAVTFTNKAAGEMRERLERLLGHGLARDLWVGTFHATCAKLLRIYGDALGIPKGFSIYDSADQKSVIARVLKELELDERRYPPRLVLGRILKEKQEGRTHESMAIDSYMDEAVARAYKGYESHLRAADAVDFDDLILLVVRLLERSESPEAASIIERFQYVLVDEFQDTNAMQYRFVKGLTAKHRNLCVVGDDDQSIYRWRGADVRNILGFEKDYPDAKVVKLEQNYRSSGHIVRAALGVISKAQGRALKSLWTANADGEPIDVAAVPNERAEAAYVVAAVERARAQGMALQQMAVFYRVHAQSRVLEESLRAANVPYQIVGGTKFYERAEVKDALSYLRLMVNPKSDVDLLRIINTPGRGIGSTTVERLVAWANVKGTSIVETLSDIGGASDIGASAKKKLEAFRELIQRLRLSASELSPSQAFTRVLEETGYREALLSEDTAEADTRRENLEELGGSILDFETESAVAGKPATLDGYLERISLQADVDGMKDAPRITLMTVHGAKGLEFELVILTGMEEDMFPYRSLQGQGEHELEEERRLAYVAITRARTKLIMVHAAMRQIFGQTRWGRPSRFLDEIPAHQAATLGAREDGVDGDRTIDRSFFSDDAYADSE